MLLDLLLDNDEQLLRLWSSAELVEALCEAIEQTRYGRKGGRVRGERGGGEEIGGRRGGGEEGGGRRRGGRREEGRREEGGEEKEIKGRWKAGREGGNGEGGVREDRRYAGKGEKRVREGGTIESTELEQIVVDRCTGCAVNSSGWGFSRHVPLFPELCVIMQICEKINIERVIP